MKMKMKLAGIYAAILTLAACSTDTYVSQENRHKFVDNDVEVEKYMFKECFAPEREIHIAAAGHFDFDKSELKKEDKDSLDRFLHRIDKFRGQISIVAHTDYQGSNQYNEQLSLRRANAVKDYMKSRIDVSHYDWEVKHYGEMQPLIESRSLQANAQNRRAFVVFEETPKDDVFCQPPEPERQVLVAMTPHFAFDSDTLEDMDKTSLDKFIFDLEELQGHITIAGHTDYQGSAEYNERLAKRRAKSVMAYLKKRLDEKNYIWEVQSFGESDPLAEEHTLDANALNRRAVLIFKQGDISSAIKPQSQQ